MAAKNGQEVEWYGGTVMEDMEPVRDAKAKADTVQQDREQGNDGQREPQAWRHGQNLNRTVHRAHKGKQSLQTGDHPVQPAARAS